jgi:hypothetical protein
MITHSHTCPMTACTVFNRFNINTVVSVLLPAQICAAVFLYSAILWRMRTFDRPIPPTNYDSKSEQATLPKLRVWANAGLVTESWIGITLPNNVEEIYQHWGLVRMLGLCSIRLFSVGCHNRSGNDAKPSLNPPQSNFRLGQQYFKVECSGHLYILEVEMQMAKQLNRLKP